MFRRPHYLALVLVVLLVLILFNLPGHPASRFKMTIGSIFVPLFGLTTSGGEMADRTGSLLLPRTELVRQNEQLRRELQQLQFYTNQLAEVWRENARFRDYFAWQKQQPAKLKLARVVSRDPANWWRTFQIDVGSRDGVRLNMPVRTIEGLVGRINAVAATRSQVLLLGDPNLRVSAVINDTRETGVIFSSSANPLEFNMVNLGYLSRMSTLKPGQLVTTSGEGGIFPKGIPIGNIVDSRPAEYGLSVEARVKLFSRMNALEEVWVVMQ